MSSADQCQVTFADLEGPPLPAQSRRATAAWLDVVWEALVKTSNNCRDLWPKFQDENPSPAASYTMACVRAGAGRRWLVTPRFDQYTQRQNGNV